MSLDSNSTLTEIKAAYDDNADYDLVGSVTKCKTFIHAVRLLMRRMAEEVQHGNERIRDDYRKLQAELQEAKAWLAANDTSATTSTTSGSVRFADFQDFRA